MGKKTYANFLETLVIEMEQEQQLIEHEQTPSYFHIFFYENRTINILIFFNFFIPLVFIGIITWFIVIHVV